MRNLLILCCCIFYSCLSLKKTNKLEKAKDSLQVTESSQQQQLETEIQESATGEWKAQQLLEIYSETPYRLHPDSGLMAGAGYLKMRYNGKKWMQNQKMRTQQSQLNGERQQRSQEKLQVKQAEQEKRLEKVSLPYTGYILLFAGIVLLFLVYKRLRLSWWF